MFIWEEQSQKLEPAKMTSNKEYAKHWELFKDYTPSGNQKTYAKTLNSNYTTLSYCPSSSTEQKHGLSKKQMRIDY